MPALHIFAEKIGIEADAAVIVVNLVVNRPGVRDIPFGDILAHLEVVELDVGFAFLPAFLRSHYRPERRILTALAERHAGGDLVTHPSADALGFLRKPVGLAFARPVDVAVGFADGADIDG